MTNECDVDHDERRRMGMSRCYSCDAILQDEADAAAIRAARDLQRRDGTLGLVELQRRMVRLEAECARLRIHLGAALALAKSGATEGGE